MLMKPDYIENKNGQMSKIYCKVCGKQIAGMVDKTDKNGKTTSKFKRFPIYAEAKFRHSDGSFHVTNGCHKCFMKLDYRLAQEVYEADMAEMQMPADKWVEAVVKVDTSGAGLL